MVIAMALVIGFIFWGGVINMFSTFCKWFSSLGQHKPPTSNSKGPHVSRHRQIKMTK